MIFHIFFKGELNFCEAFSGEKTPGDDRYKAGENLLAKYTSSKSFRETDMFKILRDTESGICRPCDVGFPTQGSQVNFNLFNCLLLLQINIVHIKKLSIQPKFKKIN